MDPFVPLCENISNVRTYVWICTCAPESRDERKRTKKKTINKCRKPKIKQQEMKAMMALILTHTRPYTLAHNSQIRAGERTKSIPRLQLHRHFHSSRLLRVCVCGCVSECCLRFTFIFSADSAFNSRSFSAMVCVSGEFTLVCVPVWWVWAFNILLVSLIDLVFFWTLLLTVVRSHVRSPIAFVKKQDTKYSTHNWKRQPNSTVSQML